MPNAASSPNGSRLERQWARFRALPGGRRLFSLLFGRMIPYSGSVRPLIVELAPGRAVAHMDDRRAVRNHLTSIHAIALANLAEMTTGLALNFALSAEARSIMTGLSIEFLRKARGRITATSEAPVLREVPEERRELGVDSVLTDQSGAVVARATVRWVVGPARAGA